MIEVMAASVLIAIGMALVEHPVYTSAYLVVVTVAYMAMDIHDTKFKDLEYYAMSVLVWSISPVLFWFSL